MHPGYQPLPREDSVHVDNIDAPKQGESLIRDEEDHQINGSSRACRGRCRHNGRRRLAIIVLLISALMLSYGIRNMIASFVRAVRGGSSGEWSSWRCASVGGVGCHCRNFSSSVETGGTLPTHYTLPSGDRIPSVALGVWRADKGEVGDAVKAALAAGYRHIDGAWIYRNEAEVGQAIQESGVPRSEIWLTSKLWNTFHTPQDIEPVLDESLARLGTEYLDLYLIHWPQARRPDGTIDQDLTDNPYPTWQKLEEMVEKGKVRNIGISNFDIQRVQNLTGNPLKIRPAVNQVPLNFFNPQPELLEWSQANDILLEAYSPLGSAERVKESLSVPEVREIAAELDITPAQVLISWQLQRGTVVLPKSVHADRIEENFQVTALPQHLFEKLEKAAMSDLPEGATDHFFE